MASSLSYLDTVSYHNNIYPINLNWVYLTICFYSKTASQKLDLLWIPQCPIKANWSWPSCHLLRSLELWDWSGGRSEEERWGRSPSKLVYPWKPQKQTQGKPATRDTGTNCWTAGLLFRTCLNKSGTSMAILITLTTFDTQLAHIISHPNVIRVNIKKFAICQELCHTHYISCLF